jgi:hypothetical protein
MQPFGQNAHLGEKVGRSRTIDLNFAVVIAKRSIRTHKKCGNGLKIPIVKGTPITMTDL